MLTAQEVYAQIKALETQFQVPADYATVDVGTYDVSSGKFTGLTSRKFTDPEPVAHKPRDRPVDKPGSFMGETWRESHIDPKTWKRTTTIIPAPKVGFAPVLLKFHVVAPSGSMWCVRAQGKTYNAQQGQTELLVNIWDCNRIGWTVQVSGYTPYSDQIMIQRPLTPLVGAGVFKIPVIPLAVVYAPVPDSNGYSEATYSKSHAIGCTTGFTFSRESGTTTPQADHEYTSGAAMKTIIEEVASELHKNPSAQAQGLATVLSTIASLLGSMSATQTVQEESSSGLTLNWNVSAAQTVTAPANGGPGVGDGVYFLHDVMFVWIAHHGCWTFAPMFTAANISALSVKYIRDHIDERSNIGISRDSAQLLLSLDPMTTLGPSDPLPSDRFVTYINELRVGGGLKYSVEFRESSEQAFTTATRKVTTSVEDWQTGSFLKLLIEPKTSEMTETIGSETTTTESDEVACTFSVGTDIDEVVVCKVWKDTLFNTFAFTYPPITEFPRNYYFGRILDQMGKPVVHCQVDASIAGERFTTFTNHSGTFTFSSPSMLTGIVKIWVKGQPEKAMRIVKTSRPASIAQGNAILTVKDGSIIRGANRDLYKLQNGLKLRLQPSERLGEGNSHRSIQLWEGASELIPVQNS